MRSPRLARIWLTFGAVSLLSIATGLIAHSWNARATRSATTRYSWDHGRCYGLQIETGGSLTRTQVERPDGLCPPINWEHRQPGMEWRAIVDCNYEECVAGSILGKAPRLVTSYVGAGATREEACQNAEGYLREAIRSMRCRAKQCNCAKVDFHAALP